MFVSPCLDENSDRNSSGRQATEPEPKAVPYIHCLLLLAILTPAIAMSQQVRDELDVVDGQNERTLPSFGKR